jgi:hypothetical protein
MSDISQCLTGLRFNSNRNCAVAVRYKRKLARYEDKSVGHDGLTVMSAGLWPAIAADEFHRRVLHDRKM